MTTPLTPIDIEARRGFANQELRFERLINAFLQLCHCRDGRLPPAHILGNRLRRYKGRTVKGRRLETVEKAESGWRWTVKGGQPGNRSGQELTREEIPHGA